MIAIGKSYWAIITLNKVDYNIVYNWQKDYDDSEKMIGLYACIETINNLDSDIFSEMFLGSIRERIQLLLEDE